MIEDYRVTLCVTVGASDVTFDWSTQIRTEYERGVAHLAVERARNFGGLWSEGTFYPWHVISRISHVSTRRVEDDDTTDT